MLRVTDEGLERNPGIDKGLEVRVGADFPEASTKKLLTIHHVYFHEKSSKLSTLTSRKPGIPSFTHKSIFLLLKHNMSLFRLH